MKFAIHFDNFAELIFNLSLSNLVLTLNIKNIEKVRNKVTLVLVKNKRQKKFEKCR